MAQGFKIADGYLDIEADTDAAMADVKAFFKEVDAGLDAEEKKAKVSGKSFGKNFSKGAGESLDSWETYTKALSNKLFNAAQEAARHNDILGTLLGGGGKKRRSGLLSALMPNRGFLSRMFGGLKSGGASLFGGLSTLFSKGGKLFSSIASGIADAFSTGIDTAKQIWEGASKAFETVGKVGSGIGSAAMFSAFALGIPIAIGLAGALTQLAAAALAIPAAVGVAAAAIIPLLVALHGFGEAVGAGLSGDTEKFNEALKGLAPSARKVAKEIVALKPLFSQLKNTIQQSFFAPLVGAVGPALKAILTGVQPGLQAVSTSLGGFAKSILGVFSSPDSIKAFNAVLMSTSRILDTMAPAATALLQALINLMAAGLPYVERFNTLLAGGLQHVADWINKAIAPGGQFTSWMERAWHIGGELWRVIKELGKYVFTLLNSFGDEGTDTLTGIGNALQRMNEFMKTKDGQEALHNLGVLIHWAGNAFVYLLDHASDTWKALNGIFNFVRGIGPFFSNLWDSIVGGVKAVGRWFAWLGSTIWGGIMTAWNAVVGFGKSIWDALTTAYNAVVGAGKAVIDWFVALPGMIMNFVTSLPGMIAGGISSLIDAVLYGIGALGAMIVNFFLVTFPGWIKTSWDTVTNLVSTAITAIVNYIIALPGMVIDALTSFGSMIMNGISAAWDWAKNATVSAAEAIWGWIVALPGRISGALSSLRDAIGGMISRAWTSAKDATISGIDTVMDWINKLPGKVKGALSDAGSWLYDIGKQAIQGLVNGLKDALGWAVDAAKSAAEKIKQGFLDHLDIGSPSRVMRMEVGRWILPGVAQGIEDSKPQFGRYLGATADMIRGGMAPVVNVAAPNVNVGGTTLIADLGDGIRQAVPLQIMRNPDTVATAANVGNRGRAAWTNTGRTVITGAS